MSSISPQPSTHEMILPLVDSAQPGHFNPRRTRIDSIDLLRGVVMVIMMLDHTRDFVHSDVLQGFDPTDLSRTNVVLFFTRWITHFCAPVFVFLAGTGAYLQMIRGKRKRDLSRFLITRGLWLILLEFTLVRISVFLNFNYQFLGVMQVIWVIGVSMILLAAVIHLPLRVIAGFGIGMIALHNLLDRYKAATSACHSGPFKAAYDLRVARGMAPSLARLTIARQLAATTLAIWKRGEKFDPERKKQQAA